MSRPTDTLRSIAKDALSLTTQRIAVSEFAWHDRARGNAVTPSAEYLKALPADQRTDDLVRVVRYFVTQRYRFDFRFTQLRKEVVSWGTVDDAQLVAMHAFTELGLNAPTSMALYEQALTCPGVDQVCRSILLHGLWFARSHPEHAERILELSDAMLALGEIGPNVYFRRGYAHRALGQYATARDDILVAMDLLEPGNNDVHQDYVRELLAIPLTAAV